MKITLCGSLTFMDEMRDISDRLIKLGFEKVMMPVGFGGGERERKANWTVEEDGQRKIDRNSIEEHYLKIKESSCILVINYTKNGIKNYIGGNTLLDMGYAFVNKKPIFLLNPIPDVSYKSEIIGMKPIILGEILMFLKNSLQVTSTR